jgi:ATP-dependent helicase IRC3
MISNGYLCDIAVTTVKTNIKFQGIKDSAGDFNLGQLSKEANTSIRNDIIVDTYLKQAVGIF